MKTMKTMNLTITILTGALTLGAATTALGQGMPAESRRAIHNFFNGHNEMSREYMLTERGYEAVDRRRYGDAAVLVLERVR